MKSLVVLFFGIILWTQPAFASRASVSFYTRQGEPFHLILNGHIINRNLSDRVRLNDVPAGYHAVEIRFPDRFGVLVHRARLYLEPGYEATYQLQISSRRRRIEMQKMSEFPINGGIVPPYSKIPRPRPLPDYNDRINRDEREDQYGNRNRDYLCRDIIQGAEFDRFYRALTDRSFDDNKMALAKQVLGQSTIYAEDLKRVMGLFSFESSKVELAKFMYNQVCDRRNFYVVYDALSFDSSVRELERHITNQ